MCTRLKGFSWLIVAALFAVLVTAAISALTVGAVAAEISKTDKLLTIKNFMSVKSQINFA